MKKCIVIGSINVDMVVSSPRFAQPGETLTGYAFKTVPGGKGANQAVALGRLGADVKMCGKVGTDSFGQEYIDHFEKNHVDASCIIKDGDTTGQAHITVADSGENCIILVTGANAKCDIEWAKSIEKEMAECDIALVQLEIPLETVEYVIDRLHAMGKTIILDPAPAVPLSETLLAKCDYITPNETELKILTASLPEDADIEARVKHLIGGSDRVIIHKNGGDGAYIATKDGTEHVPGFKVKVVDTTAAGDTFNAGFAAGLASGLTLREAVVMGNAAGALAVTSFGAQGGMPTMEEVQKLING